MKEMSEDVMKHIELLGLRVKDKISGVDGIITSVSFDLYGCIQATINRGLNEKGEMHDGFWFDVCRLDILDKKPIMNVPNFDRGYVAEGRQGSADKPLSDNKA